MNINDFKSGDMVKVFDPRMDGTNYPSETIYKVRIRDGMKELYRTTMDTKILVKVLKDVKECPEYIQIKKI